MTIGTDPEYFLTKNGEIISSIGIVGGTKRNPIDLGDCSMHEDNVTIELAVKPASSEDEFYNNIISSISKAKKKLGSEYDIVAKGSHLFSEEDLDNFKAKEFGCSADYDAFIDEINVPPRGDETNLRSCGGHIHIDVEDEIDIKNLVLTLDLFLGIPSVLLDDDKLRRQLYGKASSYRKTKYGIEYRTLSNFWCYDEKLIRFIYKNTEMALNNARELVVDDEFAVRIRETINSSNKEEAKKIIEEINIQMP